MWWIDQWYSNIAQNGGKAHQTNPDITHFIFLFTPVTKVVTHTRTIIRHCCFPCSQCVLTWESFVCGWVYRDECHQSWALQYPGLSGNRDLQKYWNPWWCSTEPPTTHRTQTSFQSGGRDWGFSWQRESVCEGTVAVGKSRFHAAVWAPHSGLEGTLGWISIFRKNRLLFSVLCKCLLNSRSPQCLFRELLDLSSSYKITQTLGT